MNFSKLFGKVESLFAPKEDHKIPSEGELPDPKENPGKVLPSGEINWNCPCFGGMTTGPCGPQFKAAFSCHHYSTETPQGSECVDIFKNMFACFSKHSTFYYKDDNYDKDDPWKDLVRPSENDAEENELNEKVPA